VAQAAGWSWTFLLLVAACLLSIFFMALTCGHERGGNAAEK
jgi:OPA family glycerol-3-phosphate transporter-like MFS transporter